MSSRGGDLAHSGFYYSQLGFSLLKKGEPPLWNPYVFSGVPLLAGLQAAFYYPLRWLSFFLEEGRALNLSFILHFFLGSLFLYLLLRYYNLSPFSSGLAALSFSFSAIPVLHLYAGHDCDIWTMVWIPLVILFLDLTIHRSYIIYPLLGGIVLGLQILACHPQHVYYTLLAVVLYLLFHLNWKGEKAYYISLLGRIGLFLIIALGLSAVQLVPSLEMLRNSNRLAGTTLAWVGQNSLPPENFLTLFIPGFLGDMINSPYLGRWYLWENCLYSGLGAILFGTLAFLSPRNKKIYFSLTLVVGGLFLAVGKYNPLFPYLFRFFPGFSFFRGQAKFIYLYGFGLAILAGYGLEYLFQVKAIRPSSWVWGWAIFSLMLAILSIFLFLPADHPSPLWHQILKFSFKEGDRYGGVKPADFRSGDFAAAYSTMQNSLTDSLSLLLLLLLGLYLGFKKWPYAKLLIALTIAADLFIFGQKYLVSFNLKNILKEDPVISFLKKDPSFFRLGELEPGLLNRNIYHRLFSVGGYAGNILSRYSLFTNLAQGLPLDSMDLVLFLKAHSPLMNGLNLKYILSPSFKRIDRPDFNLVYEDGVMSIYQNKGFIPRAYLVPRVMVVETEEEALKALVSPDFHFWKEAIIEDSPPHPATSKNGPDPTGCGGEVTITRYEPNQVEIEVDTARNSFLVLADMYYPGWEVYLNGRREKIFPTDYIFRGVSVPPGSHKILFRYEPWSYKIGWAITILTVLSLALGLIWIKIKNLKNLKEILDKA